MGHTRPRAVRGRAPSERNGATVGRPCATRSVESIKLERERLRRLVQSLRLDIFLPDVLRMKAIHQAEELLATLGALAEYVSKAA